MTKSVIQKALSVAKEPYYSDYIREIFPLMNNIRNVSFGPKLFIIFMNSYPEFASLVNNNRKINLNNNNNIMPNYYKDNNNINNPNSINKNYNLQNINPPLEYNNNMSYFQQQNNYLLMNLMEKNGMIFPFNKMTYPIIITC